MRRKTLRFANSNELNGAALYVASIFQRKTLSYLLSKGWAVQSAKQSPSRKSWAIVVKGPTFGVIQPNGLYRPTVKGSTKVSWNWKQFDDLVDAIIPNFNGLPVEE